MTDWSHIMEEVEATMMKAKDDLWNPPLLQPHLQELLRVEGPSTIDDAAVLDL